MSITRFWGEPDDGVKVRHAESGPLYGMVVKILRVNQEEIDGRRVRSGRGLQKLQYVSQVMG